VITSPDDALQPDPMSNALSEKAFRVSIFFLLTDEPDTSDSVPDRPSAEGLRFRTLDALPLPEPRQADRALHRQDRHHDEQRPQAELEAAAG
jgi:hypothetical protein